MAVGQDFGPVELLQNGLDVSLGQIELVSVAYDRIVLLRSAQDLGPKEDERRTGGKECWLA